MNKTIYIKKEDAPIWDKAKRYLRFFGNQSLADVITPHLATLVAGFEEAERVWHNRSINDIAAHPEHGKKE